MEKFDVIVIGTGQAGPSMAIKCAHEGLNTAIIERHKFGGTCVNTGCTPTKAMVASAKAIYDAKRASSYGVNVNGDVAMDMRKMKRRKDEIVAPSTEGVEKNLRDTDNITVITGHARFEEQYVITVGDRKLTADRIFINVGGRAYIPEGFEGVNYLTNSEMMDIDYLPKHLVIVGGGYIGLEFGQMFRRFGSEVTIIEKNDRLVHHEDKEVSEAIEDILEEEGINIRLNAECISGEQKGEDVLVNVECDEGDPEVSGSHLLLAIGRTPNTDDLGLENTEIETNERGYIQVNDQLETNVENIWALGDCNGEGAFTHTAYNDYEIVSSNLFGDDKRSLNDRITCYGLFIDPPLGRIGLTEEEVRESGKKALVARKPMSKIARAKEKGETRGFMKILVEEDSGLILGAAILGVGGDETIHSLLDVMYAKKPYTVIKNAVHIHPTVSELIPTTLSELEPLD
ncbi:MAG: FAD-containing oxidoreductase [Fulvivirga sp.]|nr:FAD-containing oxidoreductase [Fulvivirga sp.]